MDHDARLRHASSFGAAAAGYAEHRPDYSPAAVRWALAAASGPRVLDLGAGTGKLTGTLAALGADVIAVEPDPAMLAELHRTLPAVRAVTGSAEAIPLPDASVDAVLAGNALHWFDMAVAGSEIARVLAPGGILAGLRLRRPEAEMFDFHVEQIASGAAQLEFARIWRTIPKVVFSGTPTSVTGNASLATGDLATEVGRLRDQPGEGVVSIGGAGLAATAGTPRPAAGRVPDPGLPSRPPPPPAHTLSPTRTDTRRIAMPQTVDFDTVSTDGLESSPVADALAGLRANEARYFKNKYDHVFTVEPADKAQPIVDLVQPDPRGGTRHRHRLPPARGDRVPGREHPVGYVFYENGLSINVMYTVDECGKRAVGFKLSEGMEIPEELGSFKFARQKSKLAGTIRGSYFVIKNEY